MSLVCDECGERVRFRGHELGYEHVRPTTCTGIDGLVLGVVAKDRPAAAVIDLASRRR